MSFSESINWKSNSNVSDRKNSCSSLFLLNLCIASLFTLTSISNPYPFDTSSDRKSENLYRPATEALKMEPSFNSEPNVSSITILGNCNGSASLIIHLKNTLLKLLQIVKANLRLTLRDSKSSFN